MSSLLLVKQIRFIHQVDYSVPDAKDYLSDRFAQQQRDANNANLQAEERTPLVGTPERKKPRVEEEQEIPQQSKMPVQTPERKKPPVDSDDDDFDCLGPPIDLEQHNNHHGHVQFLGVGLSLRQSHRQ